MVPDQISANDFKNNSDFEWASVEIPSNKNTRNKFVYKSIKEYYYAQCEKCGELCECPGRCINCKQSVKKKIDNFFIYLPIEQQIKQTLIEHFDKIQNYLNRPRMDGLTDAD